MNLEEDIDSINNALYSCDVQNESIKKILFYFSVLKEVIDFPFPANFYNFENPYFSNYLEMEKFLSLAKSLSPNFLFQQNVLIFNNQKNIYKYYQFNDDQNGIPYEFKIIDLNDSSFKNTQNIYISDISSNKKEFELKIENDYLIYNYSDDLEELYFDIDLYSNDTQENLNFQNLSYEDIHRYYNHRNCINKSSKEYLYQNQNNSNNEEEFSDSINDMQTYLVKVKIIRKLVASNDWIDFIYEDPLNELMNILKAAIKKKDVIREKTISLPKNVYFYLELIFLLAHLCFTLTLFSWAIILLKNEKFIEYSGNLTRINNSIKHSNLKNQFFEKLNNIENNSTEDKIINYSNYSIIIPEPQKYKKISNGCLWSVSSGSFGIIFFIFIIYMRIRIIREKKEKYQQLTMKMKAGLNMCHIIAFVLFTFSAFLLSFLAQIFLVIAHNQETYPEFHSFMKTQLILNSLMFIFYIFIIVFYFKM